MEVKFFVKESPIFEFALADIVRQDKTRKKDGIRCRRSQKTYSREILACEKDFWLTCLWLPHFPPHVKLSQWFMVEKFQIKTLQVWSRNGSIFSNLRPNFPYWTKAELYLLKFCFQGQSVWLGLVEGEEVNESKNESICRNLWPNLP